MDHLNYPNTKYIELHHFDIANNMKLLWTVNVVMDIDNDDNLDVFMYDTINIDHIFNNKNCLNFFNLCYHRNHELTQYPL